jgi:hypothetical protein
MRVTTVPLRRATFIGRSRSVFPSLLNNAITHNFAKAYLASFRKFPFPVSRKAPPAPFGRLRRFVLETGKRSFGKSCYLRRLGVRSSDKSASIRTEKVCKLLSTARERSDIIKAAIRYFAEYRNIIASFSTERELQSTYERRTIYPSYGIFDFASHTGPGALITLSAR